MDSGGVLFTKTDGFSMQDEIDQLVRDAVESAGYDGLCEVEIFSAEDWWKRDADDVLRICIERHQTVV